MGNLFELGSIMIHPAKKQHPYYVKTTRLPSSNTLLNSQVWFGGKIVKVEILGKFMYHSFSLYSLCALKTLQDMNHSPTIRPPFASSGNGRFMAIASSLTQPPAASCPIHGDSPRSPSPVLVFLIFLVFLVFP